MDLIIAKLTDKPMDNAAFEDLKSDMKSSIKWDFASDYGRGYLILKKYSDINPKYNDFISTIDSITSQEFQQVAQTYFSLPSVTEISE